MGGNHTYRSDWLSLYPFPEHIKDTYLSQGDTIIGDGVWIGMRAFIMPGIKISEGVIIAANSMMINNLEPYSIVGGNPAKTIKYRFPADIINELLKLNIYDWPVAKLEHAKSILCSSDLSALNVFSQKYASETVNKSYIWGLPSPC